MSDIRRPSGEDTLMSSFISKLEEMDARPCKKYKVKAHYGSNVQYLTIESKKTAQELVNYFVSLIHSGKPVYVTNYKNADKEACTLYLNNADAFGVIYMQE